MRVELESYRKLSTQMLTLGGEFYKVRLDEVDSYLLRVMFCDFWPGFVPESSFFWKLLEKNFNAQLVDSNPNCVFYGPFGVSHLKHPDALKIFFTGENIVPNFKEADYALSFEYENFGDRNLRLPLYVLYGQADDLVSKDAAFEDFLERPGFCSFVYSNPKCAERNEFFVELNKHRRVDSGGRLFNNIGEVIEDKLQFGRNYRFQICFENSSRAGYTTEKIVDAMRSGAIPIYWGNPKIHEEFNDRSFVNVHRYQSFRNAIDHVLQLEVNVESLRQTFVEPWFHDNVPNLYYSEQRLVSFLLTALEAGRRRTIFQRCSTRFRSVLKWPRFSEN